MKKDLTELVFILDRSGSMGGLESDTIGGYNAMLSKQKKECGEAVITTVLFDDWSYVKKKYKVNGTNFSHINLLLFEQCFPNYLNIFLHIDQERDIHNGYGFSPYYKRFQYTQMSACRHVDN